MDPVILVDNVICRGKSGSNSGTALLLFVFVRRTGVRKLGEPDRSKDISPYRHSKGIDFLCPLADAKAPPELGLQRRV